MTTTHDFTQRYWGHDVTAVGNMREDGTWRICAFLSGTIGKGDVIKIGDAESEVTSEVKRPMDPGDQHFMDARRIR